jgi:hypothetical protein
MMSHARLATAGKTRHSEKSAQARFLWWRKPLLAAALSAAFRNGLVRMSPRPDRVNRPQMNLACYHRFASASRFSVRHDKGWRRFFFMVARLTRHK